MSALRRAAVAGRWYPGRAHELEDAVDRLVASAASTRAGNESSDEAGDDRPPGALVAPHAGLVYSGAVAAAAYAAASGGRYRAAVLVGPSHYVPFPGVSIWPSGAWRTPLGDVVVDADLAGAIAREASTITDRPDAHAREHALEMQLPFVARLLPELPIVPLVLGAQHRALVDELAGAIAAGVRACGADVLLVASSDLSHYEDARTAFALDRVVIDRVDAFDPDGLMEALERNPRHACGGGAIVAVLRAARALGATKARILDYADSGDVSGDKSSVVGYLAAAVR